MWNLTARSLLAVGARSLHRTRIALAFGHQPPRQVGIRDPGERLTRLLTNNVIPYWTTHVVDRSRGGYHNELDADGTPRPGATKYVVSQARTLWFFTRLATSSIALPGMDRASSDGFDFIYENLWDDKRGGFFTSVSAAGTTDRDKHFYCQLMALDAIIEYWRLTGSTRAYAVASDILELLDKRFHDDTGGYVEGLTEDWRPLPDERSLLVTRATDKTTSTHVNALNVFTVAQEAGVADLSGQIGELVALIEGPMRLPGSALVAEYFTRDWTLTSTPPLVSYGHNLERIWMMARAGEALGRDPGPTLEADRTAFDEIVRWSWDRSRGGFFSSGLAGRPPRNFDKEWWVQLEALVVSLLLHRRHPNGQYLGYFERTLRWIETSQTDWEFGEFHERVDLQGRSRGNKAWTWKTGYHSVRALMMALELLPKGGEGE